MWKVSKSLWQWRQFSIILYLTLGSENLENFSDEEYDDYNYQYTIDEDDPAGKYTQHEKTLLKSFSRTSWMNKNIIKIPFK